ELANYEKEDINLEKRKKHAISKNNKVSMAISTVGFIYVILMHRHIRELQ
ncbi:7660_t:CDS:1, partial [Funneliformis mosseae]